MRKKVIQGRNYGSIPHLLNSKLGKHDKFLHEGQDAIIRSGGRDKHDIVIVSLKLDGTNVGVVKQNGNLVSLQRKGYDCASSPYRQHHQFDKWVHDNWTRFDALLSEGERVVGEWMWQASGIHYKIKGDPFYAFDIFLTDGNREQWSETVLRCADVGIECPPSESFDRSDPNYSASHLMDVCNAQPIQTPQSGRVNPVAHEGLVYRVERKGKFDFMAKWVRPDFEAGKFLPGLNENSPKEITLNCFV